MGNRAARRCGSRGVQRCGCASTTRPSSRWRELRKHRSHHSLARDIHRPFYGSGAPERASQPARAQAAYRANPRRGCAFQSNHLRKRLIAENILTARCGVCMLTDWLGRPIPLELDHVDGDRENNLLDNLRLICPNCHAMTPTYRGKNMALRRRAKEVDSDRLCDRPGGETGETQGA